MSWPAPRLSASLGLLASVFVLLLRAPSQASDAERLMPWLAQLSQLAQHVGSVSELSLNGQRFRISSAVGTDPDHTHVLYIESETALDASAMFPSAGDAPGADLPDLPRPHHARRLLSLQLQGQPHALVAYAVPTPAQARVAHPVAAEAPASPLREPLVAALDAYARQLAAAGFRRLALDLQTGESAATSGFVRGESLFVVHATWATGQGDEPVITATRLAGALR